MADIAKFKVTLQGLAAQHFQALLGLQNGHRGDNMKGFNVTEQGHIVAGLHPVDLGGSGVSHDYFKMTDYQHASVIILKGVGSGATVTVYESQDSAGSTEATMDFYYASEATSTGDTLGSLTAATTAGFSIATSSCIFYTIEVDASELTDTYEYMTVKVSSCTACLLAMVTVLSGGVEKDQTDTAIT